MRLWRKPAKKLLHIGQKYNYERNNPAAALQACNEYLGHEPVDEPAVRLAMELLCQTGKRQKALAMYQELAAALAGSYDAAPDPETLRLYQHILKGGK